MTAWVVQTGLIIWREKYYRQEIYISAADCIQALEYDEKSLKIKLHALGAQHPAVATTYNNMAIVHNAL